VSAVQEAPDNAALEACWLTEERNAVLREAMATLHDSNLAPETIEAFELHCINGLPPQAVADRLGLTVNDVYLAKSRVTKRLRAVVEETTARWNDDA
jgi:DNA-directed RNA polymerase specialized sigma24 family protein